MNIPSQYSHYVDHPTYGKGPRITGLNPSPRDPQVQLHWNSTSSAEKYGQGRLVYPPSTSVAWLVPVNPPLARIPNTAIEAEPAKQIQTLFPVTHYFDLERVCLDCERPFIFFAEEQKYWYEVLHFDLGANCVRCIDCRKVRQDRRRLLRRYETLFHSEHKTESELLELASCCIQLVEQGMATSRRLQFARMLLKQVDANSSARQTPEYNDLFIRSKC